VIIATAGRPTATFKDKLGDVAPSSIVFSFVVTAFGRTHYAREEIALEEWADGLCFKQPPGLVLWLPALAGPTC